MNNVTQNLFFEWRLTMSFQSRRELLAKVAPRYREANRKQKTIILNEFVESSDYKRKYAIRLLSLPEILLAKQIKRPRSRYYGEAVQEALLVALFSYKLYCIKEACSIVANTLLLMLLSMHVNWFLFQYWNWILAAIYQSRTDSLLWTRECYLLLWAGIQKNDQCYVEQKNGAVVKQFVGYDRFEGQRAYKQLTELYRALRLYINFFQPLMKLRKKERERSKKLKTTKIYNLSRRIATNLVLIIKNNN